MAQNNPSGVGFPRPIRTRPDHPRAWSRSIVLAMLALVPVAYSLWVSWVVAWTGDLGLNCVIGTVVREAVPDDYEWTPARPGVGDELVRIDGRPIVHYPDYVEAMRRIRDRPGAQISVSWRTPSGDVKSSTATVRYRPWRQYGWSLLWLLQEMVILAVGTRVYWKRPRDESARLFFWLCIVTVGAYMGGYHWAEVVVEPILIYLFAAFAIFVPVVSLHFYLVFPRVNPTFMAHRRAVLSCLYGIPGLYTAVIWGFMYAVSLLRNVPGSDATMVAALGWIKVLAIGYIGLALGIFAACIACLRASYRAAANQAERNQSLWILLASLLGTLPIGYLLWAAWNDPARLGQSSAAWPMYVVSLLYTSAYALSITRYQLMRAEEIYNRGKVYVFVTLSVGLLYSAVLVGTTLLIQKNLLTNASSGPMAAAAGGVALAILILSGATRDRFQRAIDRRFHREKGKFDQAMEKMNLAVGSLVDRSALGQRLLEAAAEVLRVEWGTIYLADEARGGFRLAAWHGPEPDDRVLALDNPLIARLGREPTLRVPDTMGLAASDPAADTMIALGGELARALESDGGLAGVMILGPKRSGMPYEDEEIAFLRALSSVAMLALHSAGIQQTLERLNLELRDKVDKIAEQRRRILVLQEQLTSERGQGNAQRSIAESDPGVFDEIRGSGPAVRRMLDVARKVAASPSAVLIRGESGTGKELLAQAIHAASPRASRPFVQVHCAALSQGLLESELFGHVKGAFTGADRDRVGRFEQAHGGTLFLDEIGDINLEVQTKLLRVLQEMAFERVGSSQTMAVDVRILAATHQDLEALIRAGRFREDLYYRLNVISIRTPSLRERKEDLFELAVHFLARHAEKANRAVGHIDDDAVEALLAYDWPGNIRELENVIERAVVLADGPALTLDDLPLEVREPGRRRVAVRALKPSRRPGRPSILPRPASPTGPGVGLAPSDPEADAYERHRLIDALDEARGNKSEAARLLGLPRSTFFSKLKKHGLADPA
ncbi:sigma 54-interacting transcriptional regulator [Tundrisphaera sp. TA3]|uniref:sigma 54-interacting transcriptional regulator n=1 Tax=Tundrisphaera sp. TA3 TaxID=3435775 RepID=UPI003EBAA75A